MDATDFLQALNTAWFAPRDHVERIILTAAVLTTALEQAGMRATLVGGAAVEFYVPGAYTTTDLDFVVEGRTREALDEVFKKLGLERRGRHWIRGDLYVEVPGNRMTDPAEEFPVGPLTLRVIRKESLLAERIVGFRHWKYWGHGQQAIDMIQAFGYEIDETFLRDHLRKEGAEEAYEQLKALAASSEPITSQTLDALWHRRYG
ncbi:MAG TPA: hypothetical protein VHG91_21365 [Longimicrobium sp.]|nr:hypothetical protein [Longimicrobium sp.]